MSQALKGPYGLRLNPFSVESLSIEENSTLSTG